ncbi:ADP-ribosylglycohydrolase family protein [Streptomyces sp. NRRL F-4474]|uniref:ADP-ribosylglycohydrolase family protein n=1 Tax=Streptomyces sp. NRRL F-4474 TaxID=1463851 RepID=UPI000B03EB73|nr:ADP-ribosylglycohydrolase family protein [Streptomyces sp. NRRL F-4474]
MLGTAAGTAGAGLGGERPGGAWPGPVGSGRPEPSPPGSAVRLTWAQPEDLVGHELRQAAEDGRDPGPARRAWVAAGGHPAPERAGASPTPAPPHLRALAARLLDELARLPSPWAADEPTAWAAIVAACSMAGSPSPAAAGPARPQATPPGPEVHTAARPEVHTTARPGAGTAARPEVHTAAGHAAHTTARPGGGTAARPGGGTPAGPGGGIAAGPGGGTAVRPKVHAAAGPGGGTAAGAGGSGGGGLRGRLEAAWVGRAVGCLLGKPVEKLPLEGIRALARAAGNWPLGDWFTARGVPPDLLAAHPWNRRSAPTSLAENIDGMPEDDDLNYPLLGLLLLQRHGKAFTTADVARLWLDELPAGRTFTAERVAYRNLLLGLEPPATATHHNPFREWIGALIRADVHGWTNPGDPAAAAAQAYRDAVLTHTGNGVYAALFVAAATAEAATGRADVHTALRTGLAAVPPRSRLAEAVRFGIRTAADEADFDVVVDRLHGRYGHYHWVHAVPNTALIAAALTHADGDFTRSVCRAVSGGWDTDSNGATAGALAGLLTGSPDRIPHRWTAPLKNRLATTVPGFDGIGFDTLAHLTAQEAARS